MKKRFAFITRHEPTTEQGALAEENNIELISIGDHDAFTFNFNQLEGFDGVIVVHAAAALRAKAAGFAVGVFENASRAPVGQKPTFEAVKLHVFE